MIFLKRFWFVPLIVLPMAYWWPLLCGYLPDFMDTVALQYPLKMAAARQLWEGTVPVWLPNQMAGMPLLAHPETGVLYPLNLPFFLFPGPLMYGWVIILHYILAGVGFFLLCRTYGCSRLSCMFGALGFQFGSYFVSHIALLPLFFGMVWFPWILWGVEKDVRETEKSTVSWASKGALIVALFFGLQVLAGAPQFTYYTSLVLPVYWLTRWIQTRGFGGLGWMLLRAFLSAVLGIGFAAGQLIPTADFLRQSERSGGIPVEQLQSQALVGHYIWTAYVGGTAPTIEDTDTIQAIGLGLLLLIPLALIRRRRRSASLLLLGMGLLGFLLGLGLLVPYWYDLLPMYSSFRAPRRALVLWSMAAPVVATFGAHTLLVFFRHKRFPTGVGFVVLVVLLIPSALFLPRLEREFTAAGRFTPAETTLSQLRSGGYRYFTVDPTYRYAHGSRESWYGDSLLPNMAALNDVYDIQGYSSLILGRYGLARKALDQQTLVLYPSHATIFSDPQARVLEYLNVGFIVGDLELFNPNVLTGVADAPPVDVSKVMASTDVVGGSEYWPIRGFREKKLQAWFAHSPILAETPEEALEIALRYRPGRGPLVVDLENPPAVLPTPGFTTLPEIAKAEWVNARTYRIEWNAPVQGEGLAVVAPNSWAKGWKARFDDGQKEDTFPAFGFLTSAWVPPGASSVEFVYSPLAVKTGFGISLLSICLWVLGFLHLKRLERVAAA